MTRFNDRFKQLEGRLLAAPTHKPSAGGTRPFRRLLICPVPHASVRFEREWLWKKPAYELVVRGCLSDCTVMRDGYIQLLSEPEALVTFNRGVMPVPDIQVQANGQTLAKAWIAPPHGLICSRRVCR